MPGSSLWLVPPPSHPLHAALQTLISTTLPARFPREAAGSADVAPHFFPAHLTLTSEVSPERYGDDPQGWLDRLLSDLFDDDDSAKERAAHGQGHGQGPSSSVKVRFERVVSQDVFFRRCFIRVGFEGVRGIAGLARARGVIGEEVGLDGDDGGFRFGPRTEEWLRTWREEYGPHVSLMYGDVPISDAVLKEVSKVVQEAGVKLPAEAAEAADGNGWDGWDGGVVWLVPTDRPIAEWKPIATKEL
ncbi:hypothetical protein VTK56DRAFT_5292 [Thermocarpiscus australiensis]